MNAKLLQIVDRDERSLTVAAPMARPHMIDF